MNRTKTIAIIGLTILIIGILVFTALNKGEEKKTPPLTQTLTSTETFKVSPETSNQLEDPIDNLRQKTDQLGWMTSTDSQGKPFRIYGGKIRLKKGSPKESLKTAINLAAPILWGALSEHITVDLDTVQESNDMGVISLNTTLHGIPIHDLSMRLFYNPKSNEIIIIDSTVAIFTDKNSDTPSSPEPLDSKQRALLTTEIEKTLARSAQTKTESLREVWHYDSKNAKLTHAVAVQSKPASLKALPLEWVFEIETKKHIEKI